ncbi:gfo/Idh/MocA family oxidoreductase, partial [Paenarthrobacter sp. RAF9]
MVNVDSAETQTAPGATTVQDESPQRTRIALIGTGGRSEMYIRAIYGQHADVAELIALSDVNQGRVQFYQDLIKELGGTEPVA